MGCLDPKVLLKRGQPYSFGFGTDKKEFKKYWRDTHLWFARAVAKRFPPAEHRRVADVGGYTGLTAQALKKVGYPVVVTIDPQGRKSSGVALLKRKFLVRDAEDFDLVVGFRPCGASQKIVRAGKYCPVALLPCGCGRVWIPIVARGKTIWPYAMSGATKFFHICGVKFDRVGPVFMTREGTRE